MTQHEDMNTQRRRPNFGSTPHVKVEPDETYGLISVLYHALQAGKL